MALALFIVEKPQDGFKPTRLERVRTKGNECPAIPTAWLE
jgi:hypothetical protein